MVIKKLLEIDYDNENVDDLVEKISYAIEQHSSLHKSTFQIVITYTENGLKLDF